MKSGLYVLPGVSAAPRDAAWANWLEDPTTNLSKVYFGFKELSSTSASNALEAAGEYAAGFRDGSPWPGCVAALNENSSSPESLKCSSSPAASSTVHSNRCPA